MDNCFTGRRDQSRLTPEKDVLYTIPAGPVTECAIARWHIVLHFLFTPCDVKASFSFGMKECCKKGVGDDHCVKKHDCQIHKAFTPTQIQLIKTW